MNRRVVRGARGMAFVLTAIVTAACHGTPNPPPTTAPSTVPTTSPSLTADQLRCLDEGAFLADVGTQLSRIVLNEGTTPGSSDEQQALAATQILLERLNRRSVHPPYIADRASLIEDAMNIIEGNRGLLGPGHHERKRAYYLQVTSGGNDALAHAADANVKRSGCAPAG